MKTHNSKKMPKIYTTDALEIVTLSWPEVATEVWEGVASHKQESYCFKSFFSKWEMEKVS